MYLPNEMLDLILAYGLTWCLTTCRCLNKEWKERTDNLVYTFYSSLKLQSLSFQYNSHIWKAPTFEMNITPTIRKNMILLHTILKILRQQNINGNKKFSNEQCVVVYGYVFDACAHYGLTDKIYERLESLFEYSFSQNMDSDAIQYLLRYYRIIFSYTIYHTTYYKHTTVKDLIERRIQEIS